MNSRYRYILYSLMGLVAAAAVLFLIFGSDILASRQVTGDLQAWLENLEVNPVVGIPEDLLGHPVLTGLTDYSPTFDMDKICLRSKTGSAGQAAACTLGNSRPFYQEKSNWKLWIRMNSW